MLKKSKVIYAPLALLIVSAISVQAQVFKNEHNNIALTVVDYAENPNMLLFYHEKKDITASDFIALGLHPLSITVKNKTNKSVIVNQKSIFLSQNNYANHIWWINNGPVIAGIVGIGIGVGVSLHINGGRLTNLSNLNDLVGCAILAMLTSACALTTASIGMLLQEHKKIILSPHVLHEPITIEPDKMVETLLLIDCNAYARLFNFRVFDEQENIAALFDVDLRMA